MARSAVLKHGLSIRLACECLGISVTCYRYTPKLSGENGEIAHWLLTLTETHKRWGFGLCFAYLRNVKGFHWNHKRVYRIYRELELNLRIKPRARLKRERPEMFSVPTAPNQVWSMDFMSDALAAEGEIQLSLHVVDLVAEGPASHSLVQEGRLLKAELCRLRAKEVRPYVSKALYRSSAELLETGRSWKDLT